MKVRVVKVDQRVDLLYENDVLVKNVSSGLLLNFFTNFDAPYTWSDNTQPWREEFIDMSQYPGETVAFVTDDNKLVVLDPWVLTQAMNPLKFEEGDYLTTVEFARKYNRSREVVKAYLREGRIAGVIKIGRQYFIPKDAPYPIEESSRKPESGRVPYKE